jgi:hypothetical protein
MHLLDRQEIHACTCCKERWFDLKLTDGIYYRCLERDKNVDRTSNYFLMSADNLIDPGPLPPNLPILIDIEQMLVSPIHISIQIAHVKGA